MHIQPWWCPVYVRLLDLRYTDISCVFIILYWLTYNDNISRLSTLLQLTTNYHCNSIGPFIASKIIIPSIILVRGFITALLIWNCYIQSQKEFVDPYLSGDLVHIHWLHLYALTSMIYEFYHGRNFMFYFNLFVFLIRRICSKVFLTKNC